MKKSIIERLYKLYMRNFLSFYSIGKGVAFNPFCDISKRSAPYISIGNKVIIGKDVWINIPVLYVKTSSPIIKICDGVAIGRRCTISGVNNIHICKNVMFAPNVFVTDHLHEFKDKDKAIINQGITEPGSIIIEEGCWLGHGCSIIASEGNVIIIGKNSIIGANTVVTRSFPEYSTLYGVPARNIGKAIGR